MIYKLKDNRESRLQTLVRGIDQDTVMGKYMEYLMPDIKPCADEMHVSEGEDPCLDSSNPPKQLCEINKRLD